MRHCATIVDRWYEAWQRGPHPSGHLDEAALKDDLPSQLRLIGEQLTNMGRAEPPAALWKVPERLDLERRVHEAIPIEDVVQEYKPILEVIHGWIVERSIDVSFEDHDDLFNAIFELTAESVRRYASHQAEITRRNRAQYLAAVMHQLRTPLSVVSMACELLEHGPEVPEPRTRAQLRRGVRRLTFLVDSVLRLERYEPEEMPVSPAELSLAEVVNDIVADHEPDARRKGLRLEARVDPSLDVCLDPDLFVDLVGNLVHNAVRYTSSGSVEVEAGRAEDDSVVLRVRDTGPGIDDAQVDSLFRETQPGRQGGAGIGLVIACRAARAMGGSIEVDSRPGEGRVFELRLPRRIEARAGDES